MFTNQRRLCGGHFGVCIHTSQRLCKKAWFYDRDLNTDWRKSAGVGVGRCVCVCVGGGGESRGISMAHVKQNRKIRAVALTSMVTSVVTSSR